MRILLINSPSGDIYGTMKCAAGKYFPLGLGYLCAYLKLNGHEVKLIDPDAQNITIDSIINIVKNENHDVIGISSFTPNFQNASIIARNIKSFSNKKIILGGIHVTALPEETLKSHPEFDIGVIGEGEKTLIELLDKMKDGFDSTAYQNIKGIAYRNNNDIIITPSRELITDMDAIPFPDRSQIDLNLFSLHKHMDIGKKHAEMLTSRGCPFSCTFCASHLTSGKLFRPHSPDYVIEEIKYLIKNYSVEHIIFQDDTFTLQEDRLISICERLLKENIKIFWSCWARVNTVNENILRLMKKAGCFSIGYGVESGDQNVLKEIKKGITLEQCREAFKLSHKLKIKTLGFFILGCSGDTPATIEKTIRFAIELNPSIALFTRMIPYPGTEIYKQSYFGKSKVFDWGNFKYFVSDLEDNNEMLSEVNLDSLCTQANKRFYFRLSYLLKQITNFNTIFEFKSFLTGGLSLIKFIHIKEKDVYYEKIKERFMHHGLWQRIYIWFRLLTCPFKKIECFLPIKGKIIDVGCGSGFLSILIAVRSKERNVIGIDSNSHRIERAISITKDIPNIRFFNINISNLSLESCDSIVISDVLHHISYSVQENLLIDAHKHLNFGGTLVLKEIATTPLWKYLWHYFQEILYNRERLYCRCQQNFTELLERIGFTVNFVRIDSMYPYPHVLYICKKNV